MILNLVGNLPLRNQRPPGMSQVLTDNNEYYQLVTLNAENERGSEIERKRGTNKKTK